MGYLIVVDGRTGKVDCCCPGRKRQAENKNKSCQADSKFKRKHRKTEGCPIYMLILFTVKM